MIDPLCPLNIFIGRNPIPKPIIWCPKQIQIRFIASKISFATLIALANGSGSPGPLEGNNHQDWRSFKSLKDLCEQQSL
jgi:hypothetical protein